MKTNERKEKSREIEILHLNHIDNDNSHENGIKIANIDSV